MKLEDSNKIHACAGILRETIEKITGSSKIIIQWAVITEDVENDLATGSTVGKMTNAELAILGFELNGRLHNISLQE